LLADDGGGEIDLVCGSDVTVLGSFRETAFFVEAGLTGDYVPARV
jgi:hypothetical protein